MRLIDADAFKKYITDGIDGLILPTDQAKKMIAITKSFIRDIDEQPTVEERHRGKWILCKDEKYYCQDCHIQKPDFAWDYCPQCGSLMEGKLDGNICKYVYLCDKKKTECGDWKEKGLLECNSEYCKRTTDLEHAKNKAFRKFVLVDEKDPTFVEYETEIERLELEGMKEEILEAQKWRKEDG